jgi:hypothetical protein
MPQTYIKVIIFKLCNTQYIYYQTVCSVTGFAIISWYEQEINLC